MGGACKAHLCGTAAIYASLGQTRGARIQFVEKRLGWPQQGGGEGTSWTPERKWRED